MATIIKIAKNKYRVREQSKYFHLDKTVSTKLEAEKLKKEAEDRVTLKKLKVKKISINTKMTFKHLFELYEDSRKFKESTRKKDYSLFNKYFTEIAQKYLLDLTLYDLTKWANGLPDGFEANRFNPITGKLEKEYKPSNQNYKCVCLMQRVLDFGFNYNYIDKFSDAWRKDIVKKNGKLHKDEDTNFTIGQYTQLMDAIERHYVPRNGTKFDAESLLLISKLLLVSGVRIAEARALTPKSFIKRKDDYVIEISKQMDDGGNLVPLKTSASSIDEARRLVIIPEEAYYYFIRYIEKKRIPDDWFILGLGIRKAPIGRHEFPRALNHRVIPYLKEMGYLDENFPGAISNHSFRRANYFFLKSLGLSFEQIAKLQGHSVEVMFKDYVKPSLSDISKIINR